MNNTKVNFICNRSIVALSKGDMESLSVIYDCMARMVFSLAYAITSNRYDAEDVLQDTMIKVVRYAGTYQSGTNARAWVLTIARNTATDIVRKRRRIQPLEDITEMQAEDDTSLIEALDLLSALEDDEKEVVMLRLYAGFTNRDAAKILGATPDAAQKRYRRAVEKLKKYHGKKMEVWYE